MPPFELLRSMDRTIFTKICAIAARYRNGSPSFPIIPVILLSFLLAMFYPCQASGGEGSRDLARHLKAIVSDPAIRQAKIGDRHRVYGNGKNNFRI